MPAQKKLTKKQAEPNFEENFARLEQLVSLMETESLSLEDLLKNYEQAQLLLTSCQKTLHTAEQRIEELSLPALPEAEPESSPSDSAAAVNEPQSDDDISLF